MDPAVQTFIFMGVVIVSGVSLFIISPLLVTWWVIRRRDKTRQLIAKKVEKEKQVYIRYEKEISIILVIALTVWFVTLFSFLIKYREVNSFDYPTVFFHLVFFGGLLLRHIFIWLEIPFWRK